MKNRILITATTSATTGSFTIPDGRSAAVLAYGLAGIEDVVLEQAALGGYLPVRMNHPKHSADVYDSTQKLSSQANRLLVDGPGTFRLNKSATTLAVEVSVDQY